MTVVFNDKLNALSLLLRELRIMEPDEIAQLLKKEGIKGKARACSFCPMANYLNKMLNGAHFVTLEKVFILDEDYDLDDSIYVETPKTVRKFAQQFDAGKYLFLDEERPVE